MALGGFRRCAINIIILGDCLSDYCTARRPLMIITGKIGQVKKGDVAGQMLPD
jgi:hypothetical protein